MTNNKRILYSRGSSKFDNRPDQREVDDFAAFAQSILSDIGGAKGEQYICAPFSLGDHNNPEKHPGQAHWRLKKLVANRRWMPFDYDGFKDAAACTAWREWLEASALSAVIYTTSSHTPEKPRARAIFELSRAVTREESLRLGEVMEQMQRDALGPDFVKFDPSVYQSEQPCYLPVSGNKEQTFSGESLDVDALLSNPASELVLPKDFDVPRNTGGVSALTKALAGKGWTEWPGIKMKDGEKRRDKMLSFAGHLQAMGKTQSEIEQLCLSANQEHMADLLEEKVVLDLARRYPGKISQPEAVPVPSPRFTLRTASDLNTLPSLSWHVKGLLPRQGLAALFGASGSGKSFLTLDLGIALVRGEPWFGYKTTPCPVIYVALEGTSGITNRLKAWEKHHGRKIPDQFRVVIDRLSLFNGGDIEPFAEQLLNSKLTDGVIFIDTLAQSAPEADENGSQDMGRIIQQAQDLQRLTGSLVVLVHHTGKDLSKGARGHSSLTAALDAAIEVRKDTSGRVWSIAKAKDGVDGVPHGFRLESVDLGADSDGDPVTSCVCVRDLMAITQTKPLKPKGANQRIALREINTLLLRTPQPAVGAKTILTEEAITAIASALTCDPRHKRERAATSINGLVGGGLVEQKDGALCLTS